MKTKQIKVLDDPPTYIAIDQSADEGQARQSWIEKHSFKKTLSEEQIRREREMVRAGKVYHRNKYKK